MSVSMGQLVERPAFLPAFDAWQRLNGNRIAITGASGTLGKLLCARLDANNISYSVFPGDINDLERVQSWTNQASPDIFFHLAAMVPVRDVMENPSVAMKTNAISILSLMDGLRHSAPACWFFYASSSHVYQNLSDNSGSSSISETAATHPISLYGATKLAGEAIARPIAESYGIPLCIGRIFSFYHDSQPESFLVPSLRKKINMAAPGDLVKLQNPDAIRDFLDADMVVDAILWLSAERAEGIVNIASGQGISVREIAQKISREDAKIIHFEESCPEPKSALVANIDRLSMIIRGMRE